MILSTTLQTKRMKILCGNSNLLLSMRYRLKTHIPTIKDLVIICILSVSLHHITLSYVLFVIMRNFCYNSKGVNDSN